MGTSRLETFSDGVIAIIVTIMVLELRSPDTTMPSALLNLVPTFIAYALSFFLIAGMWISHHFLIHIIKRVTTHVLWANIVLLFWISLIPFVTAYLGSHPNEALPIALYGSILTLISAAFTWLRIAINQVYRKENQTSRSVTAVRKSAIVVILYIISAISAFASLYISFFIFVLVPAIYLLPDKQVVQAAVTEQD